ncbi:MAG: phosphoadenylyl-sulfate reductase [Bacteroidia bacterium]|nr:phosphoadenylyl-sulfate reductase [Bacteroidia bacterium]
MFIEKANSSTYDLTELNERFIHATPEEVLHFVINEFYPDLSMTASFKISSIVLMHMINRIKNNFPVVFIDTGFHFVETLKLREQLINDFGYNIITLHPEISKEELNRNYGQELYNTDPDLCCHINKVEPLKKYMKNSNIMNWIAGLRKDQSPSRQNVDMFMNDADGFLRIHPLIYWTWNDVWSYIRANKLPYLSLYDNGYTSVGCSPESCTTKNSIENGERNGRWKDFYKTECGLHNELINYELNIDS